MHLKSSLLRASVATALMSIAGTVFAAGSDFVIQELLRQHIDMAKFNASSVNESHSSITFNIPELDQLPCFDDIPADFMPLDSCGGYFHA